MKTKSSKVKMYFFKMFKSDKVATKCCTIKHSAYKNHKKA